MKLIEMSDYNRAAKTYWALMVLAGSTAFVWAAVRCASLSTVQWATFAGLVSFVMVAGSNPIRIPNTRSSFTPGDVFIFLGLLFLGIPAAIVIGTVDAFVSCHRTSKRVASWIASPAMMAVTVFTTGHVFYFGLVHYAHVSQQPLGGTPMRLDHLLGALALLAMLQYLFNGFTVSTIYALRTRQPILRFWVDGYLWTWWSFLGSGIATAIIYSAVSHLGWAYVLLSLPIIAATYWTYRIYFERINAKTREAEEMSRLHLATVEALATAIDAKDQTTHFHVRRVQIYAKGLGKLLHLSDVEIAALDAGALLHDVGKLAVPDHILNKPGTLTPAEFEKTKIHTVVGAEILGRVNFPYPVLPIVRHHHERWDGKGYPDGLKEEQIPITARIMSVIDCFDSIREDRPFRPGMSREDAIELLCGDAGTQFDPRIVDLFVEHLPRFEAEIAARGLADQIHISVAGGPISPASEQMAQDRENTSFAAYDQIRNGTFHAAPLR